MMQNKRKILLVGSANMDLSLNMYEVPAAGETVLDDGGVAYTPGGKGANSAVALARLGADVVLSAKLGRDMHGQRLFEYYRDEGIDTSYLKVDPDNPTGFAVVMRESKTGENRIVVYPGANNSLTTENVMEAFRCNPEALYIGFEIPFQIALSAAKIAAAKGIPIFVDAAPASSEYPLASLPEVEIFSPNETETLTYTGISPVGADSSLRAALALYKRVRCKYIVIKQGARGAFIYDGKRYFMVPAHPTQRVVDTTAAGDTFTAAMTLEYLRTRDIIGAVKYGAAAASITISRKGASASIPSENEVKALLSE